jgi:hypothetical protein
MGRPSDIKVYFNEAEAAWVRAQGRGYVRRLVQTDMQRGELPEAPPEPLLPSEMTTLQVPSHPYRLSGASMLRVVRGPTCPRCGGMLVAGRCKSCTGKRG